MRLRNLKLFEWLHGKAEAAVHRMLRPYVGQLMEEMAEKWESEAECPPDEEDIPDCDACEHHGNCPFEPGTIFDYQPPPGYVLIRRGPPNPNGVN